MYFYIDESGNTGNNLFDPNQPFLYYGVLSSKKNLDIVAKQELAILRASLGVDRIHANHLGVGKLTQIAEGILKLQRAHDIRFDFYRVKKVDHALFCFFDQVFDSGMNEAAPWTGYWTPLRYVLIFKVAALFDEATLRQAWKTRISLDDQIAEKELAKICGDLRSRVNALPDKRSQEIITGALTWAERYPQKIQYNAGGREHILQVSPNLVGFQSVMQGIARRVLAEKRTTRSIIVDQQCEFNSAQQFLANHYSSLKGIALSTPAGMPEIDFTGIPEIPLSFKSSSDSIGLELVDIYLWITKRIIEKKAMSKELHKLIYSQRNKGHTDEISLNGLERRWKPWLESLPEPNEEQLKAAQEILNLQEDRRIRAVNSALQGHEIEDST